MKITIDVERPVLDWLCNLLEFIILDETPDNESDEPIELNNAPHAAMRLLQAIKTAMGN